MESVGVSMKTTFDNLSNKVWLGKYFLNDSFTLMGFINDFKYKLNLDTSCDFIKYEHLYATSESFFFYPLRNLTIDKNKSILLVSHELSRTGAPMVVLDTAKVLVKNGFFVTVISLKDGPLVKEFLNIGVPVVVMPDMLRVQYLKSDTIHFFEKMDLDVFFKEFDLTIFVTATLFHFVERYFNSNKRFIWWIHEGSASYNLLNSFMPKNITSNVEVVCGGEYAVSQLKLNGYRYYPTVLNYGVFDDSKRYSKINRNDSKVRFLLAGSIGERKGQVVLLNAIKELSDYYLEQSEFIFVGEAYKGDVIGEEITEKIKEYSMLKPNVIFLSSVSREELYKLYRTIDVLVLASYDDPMPVVATENFMFENICLCTTSTGTSYYIEDGVNGFVFDTGDINQLRKKIEYIIDHINELVAIKKKGRKIFDDYFDIKIFERNILKLIGDEVR